MKYYFILFCVICWLLRYYFLMPLSGVYVCSNINRDTIFIYENSTWERKHWINNNFFFSKGNYRGSKKESRIEFYNWRGYEDNPSLQETTNLSVPIYRTWFGCFKYLGVSTTGDDWFDFYKIQ